MKMEKGKIVVIALGGVAVVLGLYAFSQDFRNAVAKLTGGKIGGSRKSDAYSMMWRSYPAQTPMMQGARGASLQAHEGLAPGGAARNTLPGMLNTSKFQMKNLNRFGR